jgi:CDP-diglyceride synthetase
MAIARGSTWSDLPRRLSTICIGVPLIWIFLWHPLRRSIFFQGVHLLMAYEWVCVTQLNTLWGTGFAVVSLALANAQDAQTFMCLLTASVAVACVVSLSTAQTLSSISTPARSLSGAKDASTQASTPLASSQKHADETLLKILLGFVLLSIPHRSWQWVTRSFYQTVLLLLTVWNADTGALIAGRLGGRLMASPLWLQRISPSKSLVGLGGGLVGAVLTSRLFPNFYQSWLVEYSLAPSMDESPDWTLSHGITLGLLAVLGDLWESSLKRHYKVKDSGRWLPGHGGILDRFDSSLLAVVYYHWYLQSYMDEASK